MHTCQAETCPVMLARQAGMDQGADAEAHSLRVSLIEQIHKVGLLRSRLRALGHDPDTTYHPQDVQDHG